MMHDCLFRELNDDEVNQFKQWARDNYVLGTEVSKLWHPVVREECERMEQEAYARPVCNNLNGEVLS